MKYPMHRKQEASNQHFQAIHTLLQVLLGSVESDSLTEKWVVLVIVVDSDFSSGFRPKTSIWLPVKLSVLAAPLTWVSRCTNPLLGRNFRSSSPYSSYTVSFSMLSSSALWPREFFLEPIVGGYKYWAGWVDFLVARLKKLGTRKCMRGRISGTQPVTNARPVSIWDIVLLTFNPGSGIVGWKTRQVNCTRQIPTAVTLGNNH